MPSFVSRGSLLHGMVFVAAIFTGPAACTSATAPENELAAARQRWADRGPASYSFTVFLSCECLPEMTGPVVVTVQDGSVVSRVYAATGAPVTPAFAGGFPSIDGLFDSIEEIIRRNPYRLDVAYDADLGYPVRIGGDYHRTYVDDEFLQQISDFQIH